MLPPQTCDVFWWPAMIFGDAGPAAALKTLSVAFALLLLWFAVWGAGWPLPSMLISGFLLVNLIGLTWFDFDHYRIPNWINYPLILVGVGLAYTKGVNVLGWHMLGAVIGYGFIWGLNFYWQQRHGKDGIGMGDAKLLAAAGAWLGPLALPFVTLIASGVALFFIVMTKVFKKNSIADKGRIAFGPFIAIGFWSAWLHPFI